MYDDWRDGGGLSSFPNSSEHIFGAVHFHSGPEKIFMQFFVWQQQMRKVLLWRGHYLFLSIFFASPDKFIWDFFGALADAVIRRVRRAINRPHHRVTTPLTNTLT
jgi:hypothetical protein